MTAPDAPDPILPPVCQGCGAMPCACGEAVEVTMEVVAGDDDERNGDT